MAGELLEALGGEEGCRRLSAEFYARVAQDPVLRPLFPGKSLRCATEEFGAFLIQLLGGAEEQTQYRWQLSLRESHARFRIGAEQRGAWLKQMGAALDAAALDTETRETMRRFFAQSSGYVIGLEDRRPEHEELADGWAGQRLLDDLVAALAEARDEEAVALAVKTAPRPSVFVGVLARMMQTGRAPLIGFARDAVERDGSLGTRRFGGRPLLHLACGAGCMEVAGVLLRQGTDPNLQDRGGHTPLYAVANECGSDAGPRVVRALIAAGADVNARGGVTGATPLHMAARRGHVEIARELLEGGAATDARDRKGETPLRRAMNCRREGVRQLLAERGAAV